MLSVVTSSSLLTPQMLNCISGMVEKTQRAISILQQRQSEAANLRSAEELVADIQAKASLAILEVKQSAVEEIKQLKLITDKQSKLKAKDEVSSGTITMMIIQSVVCGTVVSGMSVVWYCGMSLVWYCGMSVVWYCGI